MTNATLCREVADWAEAHPESHDQGSWISIDDGGKVSLMPRKPLAQLRSGECRTAACVAGFAAILKSPDGTSTDGARLYFPDGRHMNIEEFANQEFGLSDDQGDTVYFASDPAAIARLRYLADHPDATREEIYRDVPDDEPDEDGLVDDWTND